MKSFVLWLSLLLIPGWASATPTLICTAEENVQIAPYQYRQPNHERLEVPLDFVEGADGSSTYDHEFKFNFRGLTTKVKIIETSTGEGLKWQSKIDVADQGGTRGSDPLKIEYRPEKNSTVFVLCDAYEKTETLSAPDKLSDRQKSRVELLGGSGALREYAGRTEASEPTFIDKFAAYDLYQQLFAVKGPGGDWLRSADRFLRDEKYQPAFLSYLNEDFPWELSKATLLPANRFCDFSPKTQCRVERFTIYAVYYGPWQFAPKRQLTQDLTVKITGYIYRIEQSRQILGYKIDSVSVILPFGAEGSSSSSGGRINGGK